MRGRVPSLEGELGILAFSDHPLWVNAAAFAVAAALVWAAGTRLARYLEEIADRTGIGQAFVGLLLLGGITSLPEVATVSTASYAGNVALATNNLLGSVSFNVLLLALADAVIGREALSSVVPSPAPLLQGTLDVLVLATVAAAIIVGDVLVFGVGAWSTALLLLVIAGVWLASVYRHQRPWQLVGDAEREDDDDRPTSDDGRDDSDGVDGSDDRRSLAGLIVRTSVAAAVILVAGYVLARSGDAIATQTGIGQSLVGFVLVAFGTSLPEVSSIVAAVRAGAHELAIGDVFGTNLVNIALIFLADAVYTGDRAVLASAGRFELMGLLLGIVLTVLYVIGLLERRDKTVLRMGYDSLAVIFTFAAGLVALYFVQGG